MKPEAYQGWIPSSCRPTIVTVIALFSIITLPMNSKFLRETALYTPRFPCFTMDKYDIIKREEDKMINKKYKDRLFCLLFGNAEYKENILSLYNALCHTEYKSIEDIKIYTIDDVIYIQMKNDVSILLDSFLHLWEQQSTFNPNMPIRGFMYFGKMYDRYITENEKSLYGRTLTKIPTPRYTVLYNGIEKQPDVIKLRLSDAFMVPDISGDFEWTATMINLNDGQNDELLDACRPLKEYMILINEIRKNSEIMEFEQAVDYSVCYCIENNILKEFLQKHRSEVVDVCITEYNEKTFIDGMRKEGETKFAKLMQILFSENKLDEARKATTDEEERKRLYKEYGIID